MVLGIYAFVGGLFQDMIIVRLLGYSGEIGTNNISLNTKTSLEKLKKIFSDHDNLKNLELTKKYKETNYGFRLSSNNNADYTTILDIKRINSDNKEECIINALVFDKRKYVVQENDATKKYLNRQQDILLGILKRESIQTEDNKDLTGVKELTKEISNRLRGISIPLEQLTYFGWIRVMAFIVILVFVGWLFYDRGSTEGVIGIIVSFLLFIVFETRGFRERPR